MSPRNAKGAAKTAKAAKAVKASRVTAGKRQVLTDAAAARTPKAKSAAARTGKVRVPKDEVAGRLVRKKDSVQEVLNKALRPEPDDGVDMPAPAQPKMAKQKTRPDVTQQPSQAELPDGRFDQLRARTIGVNRAYQAQSSNKPGMPQAEMIPPIFLTNAEGSTSLQMREAGKVHTHLGELGGKAGLWIGRDDERPGRIVVRAGDAEARVILDAAECAIKLRNAEGLRAEMRPTPDGCSLAFYDDGQRSFSYLGDWDGYASLYLGGDNRLPGRITLRRGNYEDQIVLDAETGDIVLTNADCAEEFDVSGDVAPAPGTVLVLGDEPGRLRVSEGAYDTRVAGVVSGAGAYKPAIVLDRRATPAKDRVPVALVGKVYCQVEADTAPISPGTLLTTSDRAGTAMAATERDRAFGAVLGKALAPLAAGTGLLPVLVTLQ